MRPTAQSVLSSIPSTESYRVALTVPESSHSLYPEALIHHDPSGHPIAPFHSITSRPYQPSYSPKEPTPRVNHVNHPILMKSPGPPGPSVCRGRFRS